MSYKDPIKSKEYKKQYGINFRLNNKIKGLCRCEKERIEPHTYCFECLKKARSHNSRQHAHWRTLCFDHYGNKCECCGEDNSVFLELDHVNNDGKKHRQIAGPHLARWLSMNNFPSEWEIQILCANCHAAKTRLGNCSPQFHSYLNRGVKRGVLLIL